MEENTVKQYCSFCGKSEDEVLKLIEGPNGIAICDECIEECNDILEREYEEADTPEKRRLQTAHAGRNQSAS